MLLDPGVLGKGTDTHYALDYFSPSWDGKLLAYGLSAGGSEKSVLHVMDVKTGTVQAEAIDRTSDSLVSWRPDNRSFFYLRYVEPVPGMPADQTMYNARTYLHMVGTKTDGNGRRGGYSAAACPRSWTFPKARGRTSSSRPIRRTRSPSPTTTWTTTRRRSTSPVVAGHGWRHAVEENRRRRRRRDPVPSARPDAVPHVAEGRAALSPAALPLARPDLKSATIVIPEASGVLTDVRLAQDGLYTRVRDGAVSHVHRVSFDGKESRPVPTLLEGNVDAAVTDPRQPGALFGVRSWLQATRTIAYDPATGRSVDTGLSPPSSIDTSQFEAEELFATSYDGTRIPVSVIHRKGMALDGSHPTILEGYGSYGISLEPYFSSTGIAWLERGGVFAIAHVAGGGEYGEGWHMGGFQRTKLNTVLDFIACGQFLVDQHYTSPARLAGEAAAPVASPSAARSPGDPTCSASFSTSWHVRFPAHGDRAQRAAQRRRIRFDVD